MAEGAAVMEGEVAAMEAEEVVEVVGGGAMEAATASQGEGTAKGSEKAKEGTTVRMSETIDAMIGALGVTTEGIAAGMQDAAGRPLDAGAGIIPATCALIDCWSSTNHLSIIPWSSDS